MLTYIFSALVGYFASALVANLITLIIDGIISMIKHVVQYFRGLRLRQGRDVPFIANENHPEFREMIHKAPTKNVGIFEAVYNEDTDEIEKAREIQADELDDSIKSTLNHEPIVVLN